MSQTQIEGISNYFQSLFFAVQDHALHLVLPNIYELFAEFLKS